MTLLERTLGQLAGALESLHVAYMVVGGIANAVWGEPRATLDIDVTIAVDERDIPATADALARQFRCLVDDAPEFIRDTRVLPLEASNGVRIDVIFALVPFEVEAVRRARTVSIAQRQVRVVTPEDLILMKILSDRPRDLTDAEAVTRRRLGELDRGYLEPRIRELAAALDQPEIVSRWREWTGSV